MNDIAGSTEVHDHRYGPDRERLKDDTSSKLPHRWKHQYVRRPQALQRFGMAKPATERDRFFHAKRPRELLKALPLRTIADNAKVGQLALQKRSSRAQREITSLVR